MDLLLTQALTAHEDSLCPGCAQPKDLAYDVDADGWYEAHEVNCAACKALHEHGGKQKKPTPGAKVYALDTRPETEPPS